MGKKKWIIFIVAILVIFEIVNTVFLITPLSKIVKGYIVYGTKKCDTNSKIHKTYEMENMLDVMVDCKCDICGKEFQTSGGRYVICTTCSALTHRCSICVLKK